MNFKRTALVIIPDETDYTKYSPIKTVACTDVLANRPRTEYGQRTYQVFLSPDYTNLNNAHHLIIENKRFAIQDITRLPHDVPKAFEITAVLYDPIGGSIGEES